MERGWYKTWRKETDSAVWEMPAMYYRMWHWMLSQAAHKANASRRRMKPGVFTTTHRQMREKLSWWQNDAMKQHSPNTIQSMLRWFEEQEMIGCEDKGRYTRITVKKWDIYHDDRFSQRNDRSNGGDSIFKNGTRRRESEGSREAAHSVGPDGEYRLPRPKRKRHDHSKQ